MVVAIFHACFIQLGSFTWLYPDACFYVQAISIYFEASTAVLTLRWHARSWPWLPHFIGIKMQIACLLVHYRWLKSPCRVP